jgi:hypothetical protein
VRTKTCLLAAIAVLLPVGAQAANYNFDVIYSGGGVATLAPGSDNPLSTIFASGDTFTYKLSAAGNGQWTALANGSLFPFLALDGNYNQLDLTFSLNLTNNGANVLSYGETTTNCCAHLGTNFVSVTQGLVYDQYDLTATIDNIGANNSTASLLPYGGAPENYHSGVISYTAATGGVPEPATWALMILGFGAVAGATRRRRSMKASIRFA